MEEGVKVRNLQPEGNKTHGSHTYRCGEGDEKARFANALRNSLLRIRLNRRRLCSVNGKATRLKLCVAHRHQSAEWSYEMWQAQEFSTTEISLTLGPANEGRNIV